MILWWIGNAILLLVVFPVVLFLLNRVLAPIERIRKTVDQILYDGVILTSLLDDVPEMLTETDKTVEEIAVGALRYGRGVQRVVDLVLKS